jgi:hypothetical protein
MAVIIAQTVPNFGHELSLWNQKLANSIVTGHQRGKKKQTYMRGAEGGQQDGKSMYCRTLPISKPSGFY